MKDFAFIDLHIHSKYSHEDKCNEEIETILEMAQNRAKTGLGDAVIAITDHNSMLGCVEAQELIKSGKYPNIKLVNGIEFTTDISEIDELIGKRMFERCHILAYNIDEKNEELIAYSKLTHINFFPEENVGLQVCAARRAIVEHFGINIPFVDLLPLKENLDLLPLRFVNGEDDVRDMFLDFIVPYLHSKGLTVTGNEVKRVIAPYINKTLSENNQAKNYGRLKLSEVATMVKNAGGELVLAHPATIKVDKKCIAEHFSLKVLNGTHEKINLLNYKNSYEILDILFAKSKALGIEFAGIEKYAPTSIFGRTDISQQKIMEKYNLYATAGSDFHGYEHSPDKTIGEVFANKLEELVLPGHKRGDILRICSLPCVGHLIDGEDYSYQQPVIKSKIGRHNLIDLDMHISAVSKQQMELEDQSRRNEELVQLNQMQNKLTKLDKKSQHRTPIERPSQNCIEFKKRVQDLTQLADSLTVKVVNSKNPPAKRVAMLMEINKMAKTVYEGLVIAIQNGKVSKEEVKNELIQIRRALNIVREGYGFVRSQQKLISGYRKNIEQSKGKTKNYLEEISKVDINKLF